MKKTPMIMSRAASLSGSSGMAIAFTDAERAAGRLLRAPDHDAGTGGGGDNGDGGDSGAGAGQGAGDGAGAGGEGGSSAAPGAGAEGASGDGKSGGDSDGSILSDAGREDGEGDNDKSGDGAGKVEEGGEAPRLTFGEGDAAADILGAPEAYELTVPAELAEKGVEFDKAAFDAVEPVFRDLNLSQAAAQQFVNIYAEKVLPMLQDRGQTSAEAMGADMVKGWADDAAAEFDGKDGKPSLNEVKALSKQAFLASGVKADSPFLSMLEESGIGNHPEMLRFVSWVGRNVGEAGVNQSATGEVPLRLADKVYGKPVPRNG